MESRPYEVEGDSETAGLIRAMDWAGTALGPMDQWPQSLRTSLSICLACRFPILLWWGPERIMLYNDEYRPILGKKHPEAMGGAGREVWSDVWPIVGPMLDTVSSTARAVKAEDLLLLMNRYGYNEEAYFSFSYSPIPDETGACGGIFTPVIETTEKVIGARRIEKLRQLASTPRAGTLAEACAQYAAVLADARADVPFGLIYAIDAAAGRATLACSFGLDGYPEAAPHEIAPGVGDAVWPVLAALHANEPTVAICPEGVRLPRGAWDDACGQAIVAPVRMPGQEHPVAVLVAGVSPHRALDATYLSFYQLLADQLQGSIGEALANEAERRRAEALAEIDRAKTTFFSNVSHEFRTPLTLMLGPLQEVLADQSLGAGARRHLELMRRNGLRLLKLVNALLDFSRIEAGRMVASFAPVDLSACTADLAGVFRSAVERAGLALDVDCPPLPEPVYIDRTMWEKIVLNLLSNAFKFTFEGRIAVRLRREGDRAVLRVSDTGVGIDAADLPKVFERFQRVEGTRSRSHEGSGIGLALVRDLVAMHGGDARIDSVPGHGTTVTVSLPLGKEHLPDEHIASDEGQLARETWTEAYLEEAELWLAPARSGVMAPAGQRSLVFVVDDNPDMRDYVADMLSPTHDVCTFAEGQQLLDAVRAHRPDLIVSDVMMPVMDGYQLLAALKRDKGLASIPVMLLSARAGEDERICAERAGADAYLEKPFSRRELLAKIDALLLRWQLHRIESEQIQRMRAVFEQVPAAIALLRGSEHVYELANPLYRRLVFGRDLLGKPIRKALPELAGQGVFELLDEVYRSGEPYVGHGLHVDLMRGDGPALQESYFDFVYQPLRDAEGEVDGIAVVAFEVSETIRARRAAEMASRAKDEFMAMLGHELRNPLAPIVSALEVMKLRGIDNVRKEHGIIERQAQHLVGLVDDLLDVARVSEGKVELQREPAELAEVVAQALETAAPLLEERHDIVQIDVPRTALPFLVDRQRMSQVFANLLTNAAKYSDRGSTIRIAGWRDGQDIVLEVGDSGQGIAPELLPRVFDMFYQDAQNLARSRGGLGLGLTIVRSLTELHGGTVSAFSEGPGRGSTFTVRVPAAPAGAAQPGVPTAASVEEAGRHPLRILVVDDNRDAAETLGELLRTFGYTVELASDGPSALARLERHWPQLAILDIGLPGMDGYELAARVRQLAGARPVYLVALTGYGQESDRESARQAGFDHHLTKPVDMRELVRLTTSLAPS
ncbi:ATP-binding protein [Massilia agilis]|uniref:histidine kinase n=1 Tax=Massilia agilis TaxID=1811226 RepID=A0ABT2DAD2_9BURK|nr:ATP-binding protein [Massilia agilis]MCS0808199.1 ATP-binding protein [Massilia agilis]